MQYPHIDKQANGVYKVAKHFRPYILKSHTKVIVPHPSVRSLLVQNEVGDKRRNWITTLQEYDMEIKPTKLVKGQGLCKLAAKSHKNQTKDYEDWWENEIELMERDMLHPCTHKFLVL